MIGPDRLARATAEAAVPEQVVAYVAAVAGSRPRMIGDCVGYASGGALVLVGYPLHDPRDGNALAAAVDQALQMPGLERITVIGPARPPQAPSAAMVAQDGYYALPVPAPPPGQKLRNLLRRARRELCLVQGRSWENDHAALVQRYLDERRLAAGTRRIFGQLPRYIDASAGSLVVSGRLAGGRLAAFAVGEFAALTNAFFMFCFRDPELAPPGSADLVLSGLLEEARRRGQTRMNLGLGVNAGIGFFKRKWGAEPFLPYVEASWEVKPRGFISKLRSLVIKRSS
jgi:predicted alpha/beta-hydrolase family hydrolase